MDIEQHLNNAFKGRNTAEHDLQIIKTNMRNKRQTQNISKEYHIRYSGIQFENNVLKSKSVYIIRFTHTLILQRSNIHDIESGAFDTENKRYVKVLELHDLNMDSIKSGAFEGLKHLSSLRIKKSKLKTIDENTLRLLTDLSHLMISDCPNLSISFDGNPEFCGSLCVLHIFSASGNNFGTAINKFTFKGLLNIIEMHLPSNKIQTIGAETFTLKYFTSLKRIVLSDNQLKTIPLSDMSRSSGKYIDINLNSNPWHCDCDLEPFRIYIQTFTDPDYFSGIICHSPPSMEGKRLIDCSDLCVETCDTRGLDIIRSAKQFVEKLSCNEYLLNLDDSKSNVVIIEIENSGPGDNQQLVNCYKGNKNENRLKLDIKPNRAHLLCRFGDLTMFSPFDCKPFPPCTVNIQNGWIDFEHQIPAIILSAVFAIFSFLLGFVIISLYNIIANPQKSEENVYSVIKTRKRCNSINS